MAPRNLIPLFIVTLIGSGCAPDLAWEGDKLYAPPPTARLEVDNLGIDDFVDILQPAGSTNVQRTITNNGRIAASAGYRVNETVIRWVFQASTGSAGWAPGDPATHTVFTGDVLGPRLAPGESDVISFGPIGPLSCGLYQETLTIDDDDDIGESDESNNQSTHFFFVPSTQQINIAVNSINAIIPHTAGRTHTHDFVVTSAGAPVWIYGHFSFVATEGSSASTVPIPPVVGGPGPQVIGMFVTPIIHNISSLGFQPTVTGKITVISQDGCVVRQEKARVLVEH